MQINALKAADRFGDNLRVDCANLTFGTRRTAKFTRPITEIVHSNSNHNQSRQRFAHLRHVQYGNEDHADHDFECDVDVMSGLLLSGLGRYLK